MDLSPARIVQNINNPCCERIFSLFLLENTTNPKTSGQWIRYIIIAAIALGMLYVMLRVWVL